MSQTLWKFLGKMFFMSFSENLRTILFQSNCGKLPFLTTSFLFGLLFAYTVWTKPGTTWGSCYLHTCIMKPLYCAICVIASKHWLKSWLLSITVVLLLVVSTNTNFPCKKFWRKNLEEELFAAYFWKICHLPVLLL